MPCFFPWSDDEAQYLRDNWASMSSKAIAKKLGRSLASVTAKGRHLKLERGRLVKPAWSAEELQLLRDLWTTTSSADIARHLGRSYSAVKIKASAEGLRRGRGNRIHPGEKGPRFHRSSLPSLTAAVPTYRVAVGPSEKAADFLRAHDRAPMYRCRDDGSADPKGDHWRYGNVVLTDDEVVAKATRKGWDADAWRALV